jgi:hypothetical protein
MEVFTMNVIIPLLIAAGITGTPMNRSGLPNTKRTLTNKQLLQGSASTVVRLVKAIKALEFQSLRLSAARRLSIAKAAYLAGRKTNVDPFLLIALARQESDFTGRPSISPYCYRPGISKCMADCGITQHQIWGRPRWIIRYCKRMQRDHATAFLKSAKEIKFHTNWCLKKSRYAWYRPLWQCVLNRYNQGPFYKRARQCNKRRLKEVWMSYTIYNKVRRRCLARAAYWTNVMCFYYGARTGRKMARSCRRCYTLNIVTKYFYQHRNGVAYLSPSKVFITN